ncbi:MAG TPA: erythromycin esterase family protein [Bryobacteraceae bacterium]|nr:erythromycin esterase family protein [Bryobacteraceae bacterium]
MLNATLPIITDLVHDAALPLTGSPSDYDHLLEFIGDARFVLLGEASHGTHEFYRQRAQITKRLIQEKGFTVVAVEADWPDAYRVNRYVRGASKDADAVEALSGFKRFPAWMWRNADVLDFVGWLRSYNDSLPPDARRTGFYGLDLYSMHASIGAVLAYLDKVDPEGARRARHRYACFEHFGEDPQGYGYAAGLGLSHSCESEVISQLIDLQRRAAEYARRDGRVAADDFFYAEQNARLVKNAEQYYRTMFRGRVSSWNLRDLHMAETLDSVVEHVSLQKLGAKAVLWAHNSHLGDARATQMGKSGEWNVGQLVRQKRGRNCVLVGFTTYTGTVTAASNWGGQAERKIVRPGMPGSYESLFHEVRIPSFLLTLTPGTHVSQGLSEPMPERAIGVIYLPESELTSHYFQARLSDQFDAIIHFDQTRAVEPLERTSEWGIGEPAETFPSGV